MSELLPESELARRLAGSRWRYDAARAAIVTDLRFADFSTAFAFLTRVALAAEKADHHPEWTNTYNRVTIALTTHSAGGVTEKDLELAARIDELV